MREQKEKFSGYCAMIERLMIMKKKVNLREIVGTKIIYAVLVAVYYWMWARRDWQDFYITIQNAVGIFTFVFLLLQASRIRKYKKESFDELAEQNLKAVDSICLKISMVALVVIAFMGALTILDAIAMGYAIVGWLIVIMILRFMIFYLKDVKGI